MGKEKVKVDWIMYYMYLSSVHNCLALKLFINNMETESISSSVHLGDEVSNLLDGLNLLLQELSLQEVSQLSIRLK